MFSEDSADTEIYLGIRIDHSRDSGLSDQAKTLLSKFYMRPGESFQQGYARAAVAWSTFKGETDLEMAQRIYDYASKGWFGFASPVLSNAPLPGEPMRGLPISCFAGYVPDTVKGLISHSLEFRWLSVMGGGVAGHWSDVRDSSDKAPGPIPFIKCLDSEAQAYSQGKTRRGSYAAYLDVSHPSILEFIGLRLPTGDANRKCWGKGFHHGVNITDAFMEAVINDADWDLIDPNDGSVRDTVRATEIWEMILETRARKGEPYLCFIDTANRHLPEVQKNRGMKINGSNLCFTGDTLVATADGRNVVPISQLAEESKGILKFPVYSARKRVFRNQYGTEIRGDSWVTEIKNAVAFKTGTKPVVTVHLEDGTSFRCTEDHRLAIHDGDYVMAKDSVGVRLQRFVSPAVPERIEKDREVLADHFRDMGVLVVAVEYTGDVEDVYDLTVDDNHNFFIVTNNTDDLKTGVLVHNCTEIFLPTGIDYNGKNRTFVCCLSSINLAKLSEWEPVVDQFVGDLVTMLDNVLQFFIDNAPDEIAAARYSAEMERAIGLGVMGLHALFQSLRIPYESQEAVDLGERVMAEIKRAAVNQSLALGKSRGEPPDMEGTGRRNSHLLAIAPTANNASIVATSPGADLWEANVFIHDTRAGKHPIKNKYLQQYLAEIGKDDPEVWNDILINKGSVQHLDFIPEDIKRVFKTSQEIDQTWVIKHAAARQKHICQGQSVNLYFPPGAQRDYINRVHLLAWRLGLKSLYYYYTKARNRADTVSKKIERVALVDAAPDTEESGDDCIACQG